MEERHEHRNTAESVERKPKRRRLSRLRKPRDMKNKIYLAVAFVIAGIVFFLVSKSQPEALTTALKPQNMIYVQRFGILVLLSGALLLWGLLVERSPGK